MYLLIVCKDGRQNIENEGVKFLSLINIDTSLFEVAYNKGIINNAQLDMLKDFFENPDETMKQFLINHPEFIEKGLNADERTAKRARLLVEGNLYGIN